ncbi:Antigen p97-like protein [Halocaridina rubra]|uniref:Antigen p97-like protein n=1 Tax=Halocaridina rubra TaxID=373956 RepID=A0AAN8WRX2_HALRR
MTALLAFGIYLAWFASSTNGVRLCVTSLNAAECAAMEAETRDTSAGIVCIPAADRYDCLHKIVEREADVMQAAPEDVYLARELFDDRLRVVAETRVLDMRNASYRYHGVAVVRKTRITTLDDLRGTKSCHTGYGRTAGWHIPFSHLLEKGQIHLKCDQRMTVVEHDLKAASSYFGLACIPGQWVPDLETDAKLKESYNNLCTMCGEPGICGKEDIHSGYEGALRCLVDSHGDVAWTKLSAVREYFRAKPTVSATDFGFLCLDGRVMELDDPNPCHWAARPWNAWLSRADAENMMVIVDALSKIHENSLPPEGSQTTTLRPWAKKVLDIDVPSVIVKMRLPLPPFNFLQESGYQTTIERLGCTEEPIKLCISHRAARDKCVAMQQVMKSRRIRPPLECVSPTDPDDCLAMVADGGAHVATADGGDVFRGHVEYGLIPILSEKYGLLDASYFAVAVVRADSGINSFRELKGKKSCHTGFDKTAGWKIPVVTLLEAGLLESGNCNYAGEMGRFFSSSCVPGAKDPKYDPNGTNPDNLCDLCVGNDIGGAEGPPYSGGDAEGFCQRENVEAYYGYAGAFRCLAEGGGDVAFVKHTTVAENTNGNNNASWTRGLRALDFKLLCKVTGTADIVDYNTCNLARVPAHKVLTGIKSDKIMQEEIRIMFLRASDLFPKGQDILNMFGSFHEHQNLIFKDSATELVNIRQDSFHKSLDDVYYRALSELSTCTPSTKNGSVPSPPPAAGRVATVLSSVVFLGIGLLSVIFIQ